ncbi:TetR family transcriptional regulator [Stackebrandtia endophytica]|uniref:TetR family transcriptional regulator n=1 Tax=Stackebrandtia endophytica TaxID=1496996 RepID=A0A543B148_9ACTN|nr:TetR/AcrR family transcriptional regulator [Stackebrandtia endophytica]TQL78539.1 TetR family transcriptional regulator [Stackebrandtia endophytica]
MATDDGTGRRTLTRERILTEAMRLFGENGYQATSVAAIEEAAGLSPGSGALYKHFRSKADLLAHGIGGQLETSADLFEHLGDTGPSDVPLNERLAHLVVAGLHRLDRERDLNRLIFRDLARFPDLLEQVRRQEMQRLAHAVGEWLAGQVGSDRERDWSAIATVLTGAVANYWALRDVFGSHPSGVSEDEFIAAVVDLVAALITSRS